VKDGKERERESVAVMCDGELDRGRRAVRRNGIESEME